MAKVTPPRKKDRVFNDLRRPKLLRKRIPLAEVASASAVAVGLIVAALWVATRGDAYDPGERDLGTAKLAGPPPRDLYGVPLRRWREPGQAEAAVAADLGPLPASLLGGGWSAGRLQVFSPDTLFEKINGQAEQYLKFGFRELVVVPLERPADGLSLDVFLYDQGAFTNALGLHAEQRGGKPVEARGPVLFTRTSLGAQGLAGRTVFHVVGSAEDERIARKTDEVLDALAALGTGGTTPRAFAALREGLALPFERIGYAPTGAFQLGFARDFWFGRVAESGTAQVFVHEAASPAEASALAGRLREALAEELLPVESGTSLPISRHAFLGTWYALSTEGPFVFGAEDFATREALAEVVARLREALPADAAPARASLEAPAPREPAAAPPAPEAAGGEESE